mgnify:FL=1
MSDAAGVSLPAMILCKMIYNAKAAVDLLDWFEKNTDLKRFDSDDFKIPPQTCLQGPLTLGAFFSLITANGNKN